MSKYTFPTDLTYVKEASQKIVDEIDPDNMDPETVIDIKLCFEEAYINAIKHGNQLDPDMTIEVEVVKDDESIEIFICDEGAGFDLENCKDPTEEENLRKTSGRGVFMIKKFMDEVRYDKVSRCLCMKKRIRN